MNSRNEPINPLRSHISYPLIRGQIIRIWPTVRISLLVCFGGIGITVLVAILMHASLSRLVGDPAEVMHFPAYIGMLSNWSVMLWTAAAAICLFSATILKHRSEKTDTWRFIRASGFLSLYLGLDDLFRLHDKILPRITHLSEGSFYILYLAVMLGYLVFFLRKILEYEYLLLAISVVFFVVSRRAFVTLPFFDEFFATGAILKYFGIVFWLAFFYRTSASELSALVKSQVTGSTG